MAKEEKKLTSWGCPECGSTDAIRHYTCLATESGTMRPSGRGDWEFNGDGKLEADTDTEGEVRTYECADCGEEYDKPARVREQAGIRVVVRVEIDSYTRGKGGVEADLDVIPNSRTVEFLVPDEAAAQKLASNMLQALSVAVELARPVMLKEE